MNGVFKSLTVEITCEINFELNAVSSKVVGEQLLNFQIILTSVFHAFQNRSV